MSTLRTVLVSALCVATCVKPGLLSGQSPDEAAPRASGIAAVVGCYDVVEGAWEPHSDRRWGRTPVSPPESQDSAQYQTARAHERLQRCRRFSRSRRRRLGRRRAHLERWVRPRRDHPGLPALRVSACRRLRHPSFCKRLGGAPTPAIGGSCGRWLDRVGVDSSPRLRNGRTSVERLDSARRGDRALRRRRHHHPAPTLQNRHRCRHRDEVHDRDGRRAPRPAGRCHRRASNGHQGWSDRLVHRDESDHADHDHAGNSDGFRAPQDHRPPPLLTESR